MATDVSQLSDQELQAQYQASLKSSSPTTPGTSVPDSGASPSAPASSDVSQLSDDQLKAEYGKTQSVQDKSISPFEKQMTKGLYDKAPFGKRAIHTFDPGAEEEIKNTPAPDTWDEKLGRFVGEVGGMAPAFEAGAKVAGELVKPVVEGAGNLVKSALGTADTGVIAGATRTAQQAAKLAGTTELAGGSLGVGANTAAQASSEGKDAGEALKEGGETAAGTMIGGKALEAVGGAFANLPAGARDVSGRIHDMIVRLPIKAFQYGKDPLEVMQKEGIVANSTTEYAAQAKDRLAMRSKELNDAVAQNKSTLDIADVVNHRIDSAIDNAKSSLTDRTDLTEKLDDMRTRITAQYGELNKMTVQDAVKLKRQIADDFPFSPMESASSTNNLMAKASHQIYHDINSAVEGVAPKITDLNQRVSSLIDISKAAQNRMAVESRNNPIGLIGTIIGGSVGTHMAGMVGGAEGAAAGFGAAVLAKAAASPAVLTRVARSLSQMAEVDKINLYKAAPWFMELAQRAHDFIGKGFADNLNDTDMTEAGKLFAQPSAVKRPADFVKTSQGEWPQVKAPTKPVDQDVVDNMNTYGNNKPVNRIKDKLTVAGAAGATAAAAATVAGTQDAEASARLNDDPRRYKMSSQNYTKHEEGFSGKIYKDTEGIKHVGYGFNIEDPGIKKLVPSDVVAGNREITKGEADTIFNKLYNKAQNNAIAFVGNRTWGNMNDQQKKALIDMSYQLSSTRLSGFKDLKAQLQGSNWKKAANEIQDSKYAKQVPNRARRNMALVNGHWQQED